MTAASHLRIRIKRLDPRAQLPAYATEGAGLMDVRALEGGYVPTGEQARFRTGVAFEVPEGHVMIVGSRSGHGFKHGLRLSNCTGWIDADYRGEMMVSLRNDGVDPFYVETGERIAQLMVVPRPSITWEEVDELSTTERGTGGFGSTG